jgi:hypothetical protein
VGFSSVSSASDAHLPGIGPQVQDSTTGEPFALAVLSGTLGSAVGIQGLAAAGVAVAMKK